MVSAPRAFGGGMVIAAALVAVSLAGFGGSAGATRAWVKRALTLDRSDDRQTVAPTTARYVSDEGGGFVLDRSGRRTLLKFDDNPEVWVLSASRGPRGDLIYTNDLGEPFLRATKLGGMTVFTARRPDGAPVALLGPCGPLRLSPLGPVALYQRLVQASVRSTRAAQHLIGYEAEGADINSDGLIADAAGVTMEAMIALAARPGGRALLSRVGKVSFVSGPEPAVSVNAGMVAVIIVPSRGIAGRPSSERVLRALGAR